MSWMATHSGFLLDLENPKEDQIRIEDIALGLSNTCRFAGQMKKFYSVAEHSILVSNLCGSTGMAFAGLMHDATEAYIHDISSPLKSLLPAYKEIENNLKQVIFSRFGISDVWNGRIKEIDFRMMITERDKVLSRNRQLWEGEKGVKPYDVQIHCHNPKRARKLFMECFNYYKDGK